MRRPSIRANARMQRLIDALASAALPPVSGRLLRHLDEGVVEREGCVLLSALAAEAPSFDARRERHRTFHECRVNHLRFAAEPDGERALATALTFAGQLVEMLERCGAAGPFRVILTQAAAEGGCTLRFHRLRPGEDWLADGIEEEQEAAVMLLDCAGSDGAERR